MNGRCETCKMEESCGYEYKPCECRDYLKYKPKPVEQRHQCKSCGGFCKKSGCERKSIERELDTAFGLASCQGDMDSIKEAHQEVAGLRMALAQAETMIERISSHRAILRDSAIDVIAWCDKTESGDSLWCVDRLRHAIAVTKEVGADTTGDKP